MLNQLFDSKAITSAIMPTDVHRWNLWNQPSEIEDKIGSLVNSIKTKDYSLSPFIVKTHRGKKTYQASNIEDVLAIRILDRYVRRIYKVKQADRSSIIRQTRIMLEDSGDYTIMRLDIAKCYESINFESIVEKLSRGMILAPNCLKLLGSILSHCKSIGVSGLPRGLAISPTLAELYLEVLDKKFSKYPGVIYTSRYVDDILLIVDSESCTDIHRDIKIELSKLGLHPNMHPNKNYVGPTQSTDLTYLGYHFRVNHVKKTNEVKLTISNEKISKIKSKIIKCLIDYKHTSNTSILRQRINYLATLKTIKKDINGELLGGIAYSYAYVTDNYECLKGLDGFYLHSIKNPTYGLSTSEIATLSKISFHGYVKNKIKSNFTSKKAVKIREVWKNV